MYKWIYTTIALLAIIWVFTIISITIHLIYGFSFDQSIGAAIGIVGLPIAYILSIGAAINKHFNKTTKKSAWTVVKPGHAIRNS